MAIVFAFKLTENAVILRYNFSLSYCHFSLIFLEEGGLPTVRAQLEPWIADFISKENQPQNPEFKNNLAFSPMGPVLLDSAI